MLRTDRDIHRTVNASRLMLARQLQHIPGETLNLFKCVWKDGAVSVRRYLFNHYKSFYVTSISKSGFVKFTRLIKVSLIFTNYLPIIMF